MAYHVIAETALGFVAIAWNEAGLTRFALPRDSREAAERHTARWKTAAADPSAVPEFVAEARARTRRYADGEAVDFTDLPLDMGGIDPFDRAIYLHALQLGFGEVTTYGELAERAGFPGQARETGAALGRNVLPLIVPCHRILAVGGRMGGFSAPGGVATKQRLLAHEGVDLAPQASFPF